MQVLQQVGWRLEDDGSAEVRLGEALQRTLLPMACCHEREVPSADFSEQQLGHEAELGLHVFGEGRTYCRVNEFGDARNEE